MKKILLALSITIASYSQAKELQNKNLWKPRTTTVSVFKNGLGFFMREGKVKLNDGWCISPKVPPAAFGTLNIFAPDKKEQIDVIGSGYGKIYEFDGYDEQDSTEARRKHLNNSINLEIAVTYKQKDQVQTAKGKLRSIGPAFAILETKTNSFAVPIAGIERLQVLKNSLRIHVTDEADNPLNKETTLAMAYLSNGVCWIPEYTLKILKEGEAELTLRGTLMNDAEDLIKCDINLVVGAPHFVHSGSLAPIALGQSTNRNAFTLGHTQYMNRAMRGSGGPTNSTPSIPEFGNPTDLTVFTTPFNFIGGINSAVSDYTVYTKKGLTVRNGEKAIITIFRKKIKYTHNYKWDGVGEIQHFLSLKNDTGTSWTTGPCLGLAGTQALSEDTLNYTPKNGTAHFKVTNAINIANKCTESEVDRQLKAYNPTHNSYYDLVKLKGKIELHNYENKEVTLTINKKIVGKPLTTSDNGNSHIDSTKLRLLERSGSVSWQIKLKPGEKKNLFYEYERYVKSN